jgi:hypothetical protein
MKTSLGNPKLQKVVYTKSGVHHVILTKIHRQKVQNLEEKLL